MTAIQLIQEALTGLKNIPAEEFSEEAGEIILAALDDLDTALKILQEEEC